MLRYFRINDPYRLLALFVLLALLSLPLLIDQAGTTFPQLKGFVLGEKVSEGNVLYSEIVDSTPPLASWFYGVCDLIFGRGTSYRIVLAFLILFLQSAFLGIILIDKKAFTENTYVPSLVFSVVTLISFDVFSLTADLAAFGFLLLALNAILTEIEFRVQRDETIFNIGLFISLASLFNFSYVIYLPGLFIILIFFTRNSVRKYLLMLTGFLLPYLLLFSIYYLNDNAEELWSRFLLPNLSFTNNFLIPFKSLLYLCAVPLFFLVLSFFILNRNANLTKYQSQVLQAMFLWLFVAFVQIYFSPDFRPQSLLPLTPAISFFFTHYLLLIRRKKFAEISVWILLLGIVTTLYLARYQKIIPVDYSSLLVPAPSEVYINKRILVLEENPALLLNNTLSPAFVDWNLSKNIFENPQYYENVLLVNRFLEKDPPEIILDPKNIMEKYFERLSVLKSNYRKEGNNWVRKKPD